MKFFQTVEMNGYNDAEEREKKIREDAELIEALAQELETMERDLNLSQLRVGELEKSIVEARSTSSETINAIDSWEKKDFEKTKQLEQMQKESESWKKRESEMTKQLEHLQREVNGKEDAAQSWGEKEAEMIKQLEHLQRDSELWRKKEADMKKQLDSQQKESELWRKKEVDLTNKLERAKKDAAQFKKDAEDGLPLMRELDRNLRASRSQVSALRAQISQAQDQSEQMAVVKELQVALQSTKNERDTALIEVENLEKSNKQLQCVLVNIQSQLEDKVLETQELRHENQEMKSALEELQDLHTTNISDIKQEHMIEVEQMKGNNETFISNLEAKHSKELETKDGLLKSRESYWENNVSELQKELVVAQSKIEQFDSENKALNESLEEYNRVTNSIDVDGPLDELMSTIQSEHRQMKARVSQLQSEKLAVEKERDELKNYLETVRKGNKDLADSVQTFTAEKANLEEERDGLFSKLERGLEIHKRTTIELEEKKEELEELQSRQDEMEQNVINMEEENKKLKGQKADLISRLQQGIEIHRHATIDLEEKNNELERLRSRQHEMDRKSMNPKEEDTETLKKDYASAVELSITRGKKIQTLEADAQMYQSQLSKAAQKIKKLEKKCQTLAGNERLQAEVLASFRTKMREAEETISSLKNDVSNQLTKASRSEKLENELAGAQKTIEELQSKVKTLEEALADMETALRAVSNLSARKSPGASVGDGEENRRKNIEDDALREYCAQRIVHHQK